MLSKEIYHELLTIAVKARESAYAPYSGNFKVGAAVLMEDGSIYAGCNVENSSFGATMCAERVAVFKAVCEGKRKIKALAIIGDQSQPIAPCGMCLQVISEFSQDADIIMANTRGEVTISNMKKLLPKNFSFGNKKSV